MQLFDKTGAGFTLTILGYEFPQNETDEFDSNWLTIRVDGVHSDGAWQATHASLLTYEAIDLAGWLESLATGEVVDVEEGFIEPCIRFVLQDSAGGSVLRIYFGLELRPTWRPASWAGADDFFIDLSVADLALAEAAAVLRTELERFPQRARL